MFAYSSSSVKEVVLQCSHETGVPATGGWLAGLMPRPLLPLSEEVGSGQGLGISRKLVRACGGELPLEESQ